MIARYDLPDRALTNCLNVTGREKWAPVNHDFSARASRNAKGAKNAKSGSALPLVNDIEWAAGGGDTARALPQRFFRTSYLRRIPCFMLGLARTGFVYRL